MRCHTNGKGLCPHVELSYDSEDLEGCRLPATEVCVRLAEEYARLREEYLQADSEYMTFVTKYGTDNHRIKYQQFVDVAARLKAASDAFYPVFDEHTEACAKAYSASLDLSKSVMTDAEADMRIDDEKCPLKRHDYGSERDWDAYK